MAFASCAGVTAAVLRALPSQCDFVTSLNSGDGCKLSEMGWDIVAVLAIAAFAVLVGWRVMRRQNDAPPR